MNTEQKTINEMFSSARRMEKIVMKKNKEIERLSAMIHQDLLQWLAAYHLEVLQEYNKQKWDGE